MDQINDIAGDIVKGLAETNRAVLRNAFNLQTNEQLRDKISSYAGMVMQPDGDALDGYYDLLRDRIEETFRCLSFPYFILAVLPEFVLNWHHLEWGQIVQKYKRSCILAARNHGKSFLFSFAYPLWRLYRHKAKKEPFYSQKMNGASESGIIITNEMSLSITFLSKVIEEIEYNEILRAKLYPSNKNSPTRVWGKKGITCANGAKLIPFSAKARLRGRHPDWIVLDDYLDDSCLYSVEQREKFIEIFYSVILNTLQPGGQVIVVGTPFHKKDLYAALREDKDFTYFEYPALSYLGKPLWAERFSKDALLRIKTNRVDDPMSEVRFSREYLVRPVDSSQTIFPYAILKRAFNRDLKLLPNKISDDYTNYEQVVIGCDFAISSNIGADSTVYTTVAKTKEGRYKVLDIYRSQGQNYDDQMNKLASLYDSLQPDRIIIENNAFQKVMYQMAIDLNLPAEEHTTTASNKFSLVQGIPMVAGLFEKRLIDLPYGDAESKAIVNKLVNELGSFSWVQDKIKATSEHDDMVLSLWIALKAIKDSGGRLDSGVLDIRY